MDLIKIIDESILNQVEDEPRQYIGASSIGSECYRAIYYKYHGFQGLPFTAQQKRIFEVGKRLEVMILDYIEQAGFIITRPDPGTPGIKVRDDSQLYFMGHMDSLLLLNGSTFVPLEIKTAKDSEYKKFLESGLKAWKISYFAQIQSYLGMEKLKHAVIIVYNKNTSDWACEWIEFDEIYYFELKAKANFIYNCNEPPNKINNNPSYYVCQMCQFKDLCHKPGDQDGH